jgi:hypothetical protein
MKGVDNGLQFYSLSERSSFRQNMNIPPGIEGLGGWSDRSNRSKSDRRGRKSEQLYMGRRVIRERTKVTIYLDGFSLSMVTAILLND